MSEHNLTHTHSDEDVATPPFPAYSGSESYIFVSYAHRDKSLVYPEINRLHAKKYRIWYDEGIDPGNEWPDNVAIALAGCAFFLVFISPQSIASQNVKNEIHMAINRAKPFLAIHLQKTVLPPGLELRMGCIQAIYRYRVPADNCDRQLAEVLPSELTDIIAGSNEHIDRQTITVEISGNANDCRLVPGGQELRDTNIDVAGNAGNMSVPVPQGHPIRLLLSGSANDVYIEASLHRYLVQVVDHGNCNDVKLLGS